MRNSFNSYLKPIKTILTGFALVFTITLQAQQAVYGPPPPPGLPNPPEDSIPLDGGLAILAVGAAAFGIKKLRDSKTDGL